MDIFKTLFRTLMASLLSLVVPALGQDHGTTSPQMAQSAPAGNESPATGAGIVFSSRDLETIRGYYQRLFSQQSYRAPAGAVPPEFDFRVERDGILSRQFERRLTPFPPELDGRLPGLPPNYPRGSAIGWMTTGGYMYLRSLALLALGSIALGQQVTSTSSPSIPAQVPSNATGARPPGPTLRPPVNGLGPRDPVITIQGLCDTPAVSKTAKRASDKVAECKTVITRAQFELLASALQPDLSPAMKRKLGELYPTMIIMSHTAQKRGYENSREFKELLEFSRIQILSAQLNRAVQREAETVPPADTEKYYKDNPAAFEQVTLQRIFVPKGKVAQHANDRASDGAVREAEKTDDSVRKEAEALQARALAGEEFDKLQKEAFEVAGVTAPAASTNVVKLTAGELSPTERPLLDLKPGDVSHVLTQGNGYFIYKLLAKEKKPLDQAREEINSKLAHQRFQNTMDQLHKSFETTLSEAYFESEPTQTGASRPMPVPLPQGGMVPATSPSAVGAATRSAVPVKSPADPNALLHESNGGKPDARLPAEPPK